MESNNLHEAIHRAMEETGLEEVELSKPLKSVTALAKFTKRIKPKNLMERHSVIGWAFSAPLNQFEKEMWQVKEFQLYHHKGVIEIEMLAYVSGLTVDDDHEAWLDGLIGLYCHKEHQSYSYHWTPRYWSWDSVERVSDVTGFVKMKKEDE